MRTNQKYAFFSGLAILLQFCISKISFWYFKKISDKRITLIRKQGIGDAIFTTGVLYQFQNRYPATKIKLVSNHPSIFEMESSHSFSLRDFPFVWMMYGHYDFSFFRKGDKHIKTIIAEHLKLSAKLSFNYRINLSKLNHSKFISKNIKNKNYIVIHPWAGHWNTGKNWLLIKWNELVQMLTQNGHVVYQIGEGKDLPINGVKHFQGACSLHESIALIKNADLFIGINSFGEQVAGAFDIKSVILYGPTNPAYSLNENQFAISGANIIEHRMLPNLRYEFKSVEIINSDLVFGQCIKLLNGMTRDSANSI